jgi:hypothetical protein
MARTEPVSATQYSYANWSGATPVSNETTSAPKPDGDNDRATSYVSEPRAADAELFSQLQRQLTTYQKDIASEGNFQPLPPLTERIDDTVASIRKLQAAKASATGEQLAQIETQLKAAIKRKEFLEILSWMYRSGQAAKVDPAVLEFINTGRIQIGDVDLGDAQTNLTQKPSVQLDHSVQAVLEQAIDRIRMGGLTDENDTLDTGSDLFPGLGLDDIMAGGAMHELAAIFGLIGHEYEHWNNGQSGAQDAAIAEMQSEIAEAKQRIAAGENRADVIQGLAVQYVQLFEYDAYLRQGQIMAGMDEPPRVDELAVDSTGAVIQPQSRAVQNIIDFLGPKFESYIAGLLTSDGPFEEFLGRKNPGGLIS